MGGLGAQGWWSEQGQAWAASVGFLLYQHFSWCFLPGCPFRDQPPLPSPGHISPHGSGTWPPSLLWGDPLESLHIRGQRLRAPGASQTGRGLKGVWWGGAGKVGKTLRRPDFGRHDHPPPPFQWWWWETRSRAPALRAPRPTGSQPLPGRHLRPSASLGASCSLHPSHRTMPGGPRG